MDQTPEQKLQRYLDETHWVSAYDSRRLENLLAQIHGALDELAARANASPETRAQRTEELRSEWMNACEACLSVDAAEQDLPDGSSTRTQASREKTVSLRHAAHSIWTSLQAATRDGQHATPANPGQAEEFKPSFIRKITAEEFRTLSDEGVV